MPSREQTVTDAIRIFENAEYPSGLSAATAWLGIYQTLLWYEPANAIAPGWLPHIIDADKLRPSSARQNIQRNLGPWQRRAQAVHTYLAEQLRCQANDVPNKVDRLMRQPNYQDMQRQNSLGIAFAGLVGYVLKKFGSPRLSYETEVVADAVFPTIAVPGRSTTPRIDILVRVSDVPRAIISAKWSVRHDRIGDITTECPVYKAAYERIYRKPGRGSLLYYVITNEYDPARLTKMVNDPCFNGVVHVHKPAVVNVCDLDNRLSEMLDLTDLVGKTFLW